MLIYQENNKPKDPQEGRKMGQSRNPAKKTTTTAAKRTASRGKSNSSAVSSVADFKRRRQGIPLTLPSGLGVLARRVELQSYIKRGEVPNALMGIVSETLEKGQAIDLEKTIMEGDQIDLQKLDEMYDMVNNMVIEMLMEPRVRPTTFTEEDEVPEGYEVGDEIPDNLRDDETLYVDEVDEEDKMFLFQWSMGGTDDVATFRFETGASMDALAEVAGSPRPSQSAARSRGR